MSARGRQGADHRHERLEIKYPVSDTSLADQLPDVFSKEGKRREKDGAVVQEGRAEHGSCTLTTQSDNSKYLKILVSLPISAEGKINLNHTFLFCRRLGSSHRLHCVNTFTQQTTAAK